MDNVIVTNKFGIEFEVARVQALDFVKQGDINESDIKEIEEIKETKEGKLVVTETDIYVDFKAKFGKEVPNNKKNDIEWIELQLTK